MMYIYFISLLGVVGLISFLLIARKNKILDNEQKKAKLLKLAKILSIIYLVAEFFLLFIPSVFAHQYEPELLEGLGYRFTAILYWLNQVAIITIPFALFFKKRNITVKVIAWFVIPVCLLNCLYFNKFYELFEQLPTFQATYSLKGLGGLHFLGNPNAFNDFLVNINFRAILFEGMLIIELFTAFVAVLLNADKVLFRSFKEFIITLVQAIFLIITIMPIYVPQFIFGTQSNIFLQPFNLTHILWLAEVVIEIVVISLCCRHLDKDSKWILAFTLTLALTMNYHQMFNIVNEINCHRLPLQLCNVAPYLLLLTLLTRNKKLFSFTLVINVTGALIALFMLGNDTDIGILSPWNMHYFLEHQNVLVTPVIMLTLGLFEPLKGKDFIGVVLGWLIYFTIVYVLGILFNGLETKTGDSWYNCNYFFMFDPERAKDFLDYQFIQDLFNKEFVLFGPYKVSLIQPCIFGAFFILFTIVFFILKPFSKIFRIRKKETELMAG